MPEPLANSAVITTVLCDYLGLGGREMKAQSPFTQFHMAFTDKAT